MREGTRNRAGGQFVSLPVSYASIVLKPMFHRPYPSALAVWCGGAGGGDWHWHWQEFLLVSSSLYRYLLAWYRPLGA